jgi:hypothetical protein
MKPSLQLATYKYTSFKMANLNPYLITNSMEQSPSGEAKSTLS